MIASVRMIAPPPRIQAGAAGERGDLAALTCRRTPAASAPGRFPGGVTPDLRVCVTLPGLYWLDEVVECTRLEYALRFQNESHSEGRTVAFWRERGAIECVDYSRVAKD